MITYAQAREALQAALAAALATVPGAPALEVDEPRLADPDPDAQDNRYRAVLVPLGRGPAEDQLATPPPWRVEARFGVGLNGVGPDDAARTALLDAMATACSQAIDDDYSLGGVVSYAEATGLDSETDKQSGFAPDALLDIKVTLEFDALTRLG